MGARQGLWKDPPADFSGLFGVSSLKTSQVTLVCCVEFAELTSSVYIKHKYYSFVILFKISSAQILCIAKPAFNDLPSHFLQ
ncbi:hypothetical protein AV530_008805 [Patagioenas fasciata monilis]|uniref:Uncharacterized protein n=1 Tax=Patagioenas fasciata monilis TaxID=372326 RepID=A0A1V4JF65_PATFA|nr:hypothetical protein AV530_008805 [Patagioenas fasciata monilis]